jgi:uncharacterized membrane protein
MGLYMVDMDEMDIPYPFFHFLAFLFFTPSIVRRYFIGWALAVHLHLASLAQYVYGFSHSLPFARIDIDGSI